MTLLCLDQKIFGAHFFFFFSLDLEEYRCAPCAGTFTIKLGVYGREHKYLEKQLGFSIYSLSIVSCVQKWIMMKKTRGI